MTTQYRKQKKLDAKDNLISTTNEHLDVRDTWLGIRHLKKGYTPQPYHRKTTEGKHIPLHERAEETAKYLAKEQWGKAAGHTDDTPFRTRKIIKDPISVNIGEITMEEIQHRLKKLKRRKSPGPDNIPMELFLEMNEASMEKVRETLNEGGAANGYQRKYYKQEWCRYSKKETLVSYPTTDQSHS